MNARLLTLAVSALLATGAAHAATVTPTFNLTGSWSVSATGEANAFIQEGTALSYSYVNATFSQQFVGRYTSPTVIQGIQTRVNRTNGCSTAMQVTLTALNAGFLSLSATALDSNCDLAKGQVFTGTISRLL